MWKVAFLKTHQPSTTLGTIVKATAVMKAVGSVHEIVVATAVENHNGHDGGALCP